MMKKLLGLACLAVAAVCAAAPPQSVVVGTSSTVILPKRDITSAVAWVTNTTYAQGAYVMGGANSDIIYMALVAGTSSNAAAAKPVFLHGSATEGSVTWYRVEKGPRLACVIYDGGTNEVWLSCGTDSAVLNKGIHVATAGTFNSTGLPQGVQNLQVVGIAVTNATVMFQEW